MSSIPRDKSFDSTLALLSEGYPFISNRCRRYQSDLFETRLMLQKVICMMGEEAAQLFYDDHRFTRRGAIPKTTLKLLQDKGSVQLMDGEPHRRRKQMFMSLMTPGNIQQLVETTAEQWRAQIERWKSQDEIVLFQEVREILCRAVCRWVGIPLTESEAKQRTREFGAMIDGAGAIGPRNWRGMLLRMGTERWGRQIIEEIRTGQLKVADGCAAQVIAWHRDLDGALLDTAVAAVELLNVLRPTVAVDRFVIFAALALHAHPECRQTLLAGDDEELTFFVQEVRRFYPFFSSVGGRVLNEFDWRGYHFAKGRWVLLDLYGTNHDPRIWEKPEAFRPERFRRWNGSRFNFIPQGGGDYDSGHRCAGERITIELMKRAVRLLTTAMHYDVPPQDLRIDLSKMPALPKSRFVIRNVRPAGRATTDRGGMDVAA